MRIETYPLWEEGEYTYMDTYPVPGSWRPSVTAYLHEEEEKVTDTGKGADTKSDTGLRPAIVITPGGGYCMPTCTEGEIVAMSFYEKGYNAFVVAYTTDLLMAQPLKLQPLKDLSRAIVLIRSRAEEFHLGKLAVCGFSAGGHLAGTITVHYGEPALKEEGRYAGISNKPDAAILCYPVITAGEFAHKDSFRVLLGENPAPEEMEYMSLEKQINAQTPPTFLWHCATDELVPVENSLLYEAACRKAGVPCEMHIFDHGVHGMSVATEEWANGPYRGLYTMGHFFEILQTFVDSGNPLPPPFDQVGTLPPGTDVKAMYLQVTTEMRKNDRGDRAIAQWPALADHWMSRLWS